MLRNLDSKNFSDSKWLFLTLKKGRSVVAILIFNVPARTMKRERFALARGAVTEKLIFFVGKHQKNFGSMLNIIE